MDHNPPSDIEPAASSVPHARLFRAVEVTDGFWSLNSHWPFPVTPLYADFEFGRHQKIGWKAGDEEFRDPTVAPERDTWRVIDGWVYFGSPGPATATPERIAKFDARLCSGHEHVVVRRWHARTRPALVATVDRLRAVHRPSLTLPALRAHIHALSDLLTAAWSAHFINLWAAAIIVGRWALCCRERLDLDDAAIVRLLTGHSAASSGPGVLMATLAARTRDDPALVAALSTQDPWSSDAVRSLLRPYLEAYGHRSLEFEYVFPTPEEQPERAVLLLQSAVARLEAGVAIDRSRIADATAAVLAAARRRLPHEAARTEWESLLDAAQTAYALREDDAGFVNAAHGLMRYALWEAGRRMTVEGVLPDPDAVFFLRRDEVDAYLTRFAALTAPPSLPGKGASWATTVEASADRLQPRAESDPAVVQRGSPPLRGEGLGERSASRKALWEQQRRSRPPARIGAPPPPQEPLPLSPAAQRIVDGAAWYFTRQGPVDAPARADRAIRGTAAAPGRYRGPARVVRTERDFDRVRPGDVLVCPTTNPAWTLLFTSIGALVSESGGVLSHPAIAAREFGIPAVVGIAGATRMLRDGQVVEVDGTAGIVRY